MARALMDAGNEPPEAALRVRAGARERVEAELRGGRRGVARRPGGADGDRARRAARHRRHRGVPVRRRGADEPRLAADRAAARAGPACACSTRAPRPGGKTGQLAELLGDGGAGLVCVEQDPKRCDALRDALRRQGAEAAEVVCADAAAGRPARAARSTRSCSTRRAPGSACWPGRPDLRWRRTPDDVVQLADAPGAAAGGADGRARARRAAGVRRLHALAGRERRRDGARIPCARSSGRGRTAATATGSTRPCSV